MDFWIELVVLIVVVTGTSNVSDHFIRYGFVLMFICDLILSCPLNIM